MTEIEKKASKYAERVRDELSLRPIYGVEPIVVSNAHRLGYIKGAEEVKTETEEHIFYLERKLRKWHYIAIDLIVVLVVMVVILIINGVID